MSEQRPYLFDKRTGHFSIKALVRAQRDAIRKKDEETLKWLNRIAFWNGVWSVISSLAGAADGDARSSFLHYITRPDGQWTEWRFCGKLGFGGKLWREHGATRAPYVSCYPEDETPERKRIVEQTNITLKELFDRWTASTGQHT